MAACGQPTTSPSESPFGDSGAPTDLADVPQPRLATIDLGSGSPGYDGAGSFYSYDSDLSPDATISAYASQLLRAGFHEAERNGVWRVFVGPRLTVWVRVGSGGPPTSLVVRVQPTVVEVAGEAESRPSATAHTDATAGGGTGAGAARPTAKPVGQQRRPDPPHGTVGAITAAGGSGGGTIAAGSASGGSTGTGSGTTTGGSSAGNVTGGAGTGTGGGDFTRP